MMFFFACCVVLLAAVHAQPPVPEQSKFGRVITISVVGHFHPVIDIGGAKFKEGIKRAGIMNDEQLLVAGRAAMDKLTATFGINTDFVKDNNILHNNSRVEDADGTWRFEIGMMGPNTNIHVLSETVRTKDRKVKGRKPQHSVRLSFFYMKLVCLKDNCPVTGGTVVKSTEAIVQWLASEQEDMDAGWNYVVQVQGTEMFFTHSPIHPFIVVGILKDKVHSPMFGNGTICGVLEIDKKNARMDVSPPQPKIKLHYLLVFPELLDSLPDWAEPKAPKKPVSCAEVGHPFCSPAVSPGDDQTQLNGRELTLFADGYFYRNNDANIYRRILTAAGLETNQSVVEWGRSALEFMDDQFGITSDETSIPDNVILHDPPEAMTADGNWKVEVGLMDPTYTNIQIVSEAITYDNGKTEVRVPAEPVVASFAFIRASCVKEFCTVKGGVTVPQSSRAIVQWLVTEGPGDIKAAYQSFTVEMFQQYVYLNAAIIRGVVKNVYNSTKYGQCETNGNLEFDMTRAISFGENGKMPKLNMCYVVTCSKLQPAPKPSGCGSEGYLYSMFIFPIFALLRLMF